MIIIALGTLHCFSLVANGRIRRQMAKEIGIKTDSARILVIAAGVNGSICAVDLYKAGVDVTVLACGKRYEEIRASGIVIENPFKNTRSLTQVPAINRLDPQDIYDYILVVIRKNQVADLLPVLGRNRSPNLVFMVNNLSGPDEFTRVLGRERVMLSFVFGAGKRDGSAIRAMARTASSLAGPSWPSPFGELDGTITPRLKRLVAILRRAGFPAGISQNVADYLATHAAGFPQPAEPEDLDLSPTRGMDRKLILELAQRREIEQHANLFLLGPTGCWFIWTLALDCDALPLRKPFAFRLTVSTLPSGGL